MPVEVIGRPTKESAETVNHTPTEISMRSADAGIDDVNLHSRARAIVGVISIDRAKALIDPVQPPRCVYLCCGGTGQAVLFDKRNSRIVCQFGGTFFRH